MNTDWREQWNKNGYVVVRNAFSPDFTARLRKHCEFILQQWRTCDPQTGAPGTITHCMRHLNHPAYAGPNSQCFNDIMEAIVHPNVLNVARAFLGEEPIFRCTSLFFNPLTGQQDGDWHRDSQFVARGEEAERALIAQGFDYFAGAQVQVALVPSEDIEVVPGSHLRFDTPGEYAIRLADNKQHNRSNNMPGAVRVPLEAGDAVMFNPMGLHRGRYHSDKLRRTLMLTYSTRKGATFDYFTDQPWFLDDGYLAGLKPATRDYFASFVNAFKAKWLEKRQVAVNA
jgi:ectoine hydroxylase-related dioxygenase (phytanoyl-CoA dioxygenase family)